MHYGGASSSKVRAACRSAVAKPSVNSRLDPVEPEIDAECHQEERYKQSSTAKEDDRLERLIVRFFF